MNFDQISKEVRFEAVRSRGPGGQNVNKVSSAAMLFWSYLQSWALSDDEKMLVRQKLQSSINKENQIYLRSDEFRDLEKNKSRCIAKLYTMLEHAFFKPKKRHATRPTKGSKLRKREGKTRRAEVKRARQKVW
jgi:ribosome-associated protein